MRGLRRFDILGALVLAGGLALPTSGAWAQSSGGSLVLIGGSLSEDVRILSEIVRLADAADPTDAAPTIAIVTAAARTAQSPDELTDEFNNTVGNGIYYGNLFGGLGAQTYAVPVDVADDFPGDPYRPANAFDLSVAAAIASADGVFFGGGDQTDYLRSLYTCVAAPDDAFTSCQDTPVMTAIRTVYQNGGVIAGTSAGDTIQQGGIMVTGGESYEALRDGSEAGYFSDPRKLAYIPYGGNGFFTHGFLDSHFTTWGRPGRMIQLSVEHGRRPVFGIDETTALVVERLPNGQELR